MKEATKKTQVTELICKQVQLMRKGGANQTEIGKLLGMNPCTVSRIEAAGYDLAVYIENRRHQRQKEKIAKEAEKVTLYYDPDIAEEYKRELAEKAEEDRIAGQIEMALTMEKPEMSEQTKMMRFQAAQVDKLIMKLDQIYNAASMILRAIRKE